MAAARTCFAAVLPTPRPFYTFCSYFALLHLVFLFLFREAFCARITYSKEDLIKIGFTCKSDVTRGFQQNKGIPDSISRPDEAPWCVIADAWSRSERRKRQKKKRGCRGGIKIRLVRLKHRLGFPTGILMNVRSVRDKMDELRLLTNAPGAIRDADAIVVTETLIFLM